MHYGHMNTKTPTPVPFAVAACSFGIREAINANNEVVMQLTPAGIFKPADDRPLKVPHWHIDKAIATKVIDRFNARKQRVVVDYEHQTLHKEENGQPAPAAGWMRELIWREGEGLFARVKLTKRARAAIEDEEYLFVSPVFRYATNGDVTEIEMAALTNDPGIHGMQALELRAAATFGYQTEEPVMNKLLAALIAALSLPQNTSEDDAVAALTAHIAKDPFKNLRETLGLPSAASETELVAACTSLKTKNIDPAQYVPVGVVTELKNEIAALTRRVNEGDEKSVAEEIEAAIADGRLHGSMKTWAEDLAKSDRAALTRYLKDQPTIAALTGSQTGGKHPAPNADSETGLTADEIAICTQLNITHDEFKKSKKEVAK